MNAIVISESHDDSMSLPFMFDTLKFSKRLALAGMPQRQAEELAEAQKDIFLETLSNSAATKSDIVCVRNDISKEVRDLRKEMGDIRKEIDSFRNDVSKEVGDLRKEIDSFRNDVSKEIDGLRKDMSKEVDSLRNDMNKEVDGIHKDIQHLRVEFDGKFLLLYWMLGFILAFCTAILLKSFF